MSQQTLTNPIYLNTIDEEHSGKSVLIINPRHPNRLPVLSQLINELDAPIYYYAVSSEIFSIKHMLSGMMNDLQFPSTFGQQTYEAFDTTRDPRLWAEAFANDLGDLHKDSFILVLDQLDYIQSKDPEAYNVFFTTFAERLASHVKLVISGRDLYRHPWNEMVRKDMASIIGSTQFDQSGIFDTPPSTGVIEFYALTSVARVLSDGVEIKTWDGALPRHLCYFFIEKKRATRDEIFETFWPHLQLKEATNVFHVTKRKISEKLGYELTTFRNGFYEISEDLNILYDAHEFEQTYQAAFNEDPDAGPNKWYRAASLYKQPYLTEVELPWANAKREELRGYHVQILTELARYHERENNSQAALTYYLRAATEKPEREDIQRNIMTLYHQQKAIGAIVSQYQFLERELKQQFGLEPSRETRDLYKSFISGD